MKKQTIKATMNIYGNLCGYIGAKREVELGCDAVGVLNAKEWLSEKLETGGYNLSSKSYITIADVEDYRAWLNNNFTTTDIKEYQDDKSSCGLRFIFDK